MNKKIIIIILAIIILAAGGGIYYYSKNSAAPEADDFSQLEETPDIDLADSPLGKADLPEIEMDLGFTELGDIGLSLDSGDQSLQIPEANIGEIDIAVPSLVPDSFNLSLPSQTTAPTASETPDSGSASAPPVLDDSVCSAFGAVPSCSYVPAENRELCQDCKGR